MSKTPKNKLSPQRRWQRKMIRQGRCSRCGKVRGERATLCDRCAEVSNASRRRSRGFRSKPWTPGIQGKIPKDPKARAAYRRCMAKASKLYKGGMTIEETARALGIGCGAVITMLRRSKTKRRRRGARKK